LTAQKDCLASEVAEPYLDEHIAQRWSDLVRSAQTN